LKYSVKRDFKGNFKHVTGLKMNSLFGGRREKIEQVHVRTTVLAHIMKSVLNGLSDNSMYPLIPVLFQAEEYGQ
jgi:hypothetical protein